MTATDLPLIIEPADLASAPPDGRRLLITVCQARVFLAHHVPGSLLIEPGELVSGVAPAIGKLPPVERLAELFSRLGLEDDRHVVAIDDEGGGWAGRLIWTLDVLGHSRRSLLNGGALAWAAAGLPLESGPPARTGSARPYRARIDHNPIASMEQVLAEFDDPGSIVWDARSAEEYHGLRATARRNGHIPGAVNLDWLELIDRHHDFRLKPLPELRARLEALGIGPDKKIITHCQTHHRSALAYFVGKALGLDIRAYDGSWSEWGNADDTPIEN